MKPRFVFNSSLCRWLKVDAILLFPFIFCKDNQITPRLFRHEIKHWEQCLKHWVIGFYVMYLLDYFLNRLKGMSHFSAYFWIPFEIEARKAEREEESGVFFETSLR